MPDQTHPPHQTLFNAATIGNVDLANPVALAPMTRVSATADGRPPTGSLNANLAAGLLAGARLGVRRSIPAKLVLT